MVKKYHIKWTAPAREDVNEIIDYISEKNLAFAVKALDKIEEEVNKLVTFPERYRVVPELAKYGYVLYRNIIVDYWRVIYKIEKNFVYIMLVVDSRRNLEDLILKKILFREKEML